MQICVHCEAGPPDIERPVLVSILRHICYILLQTHLKFTIILQLFLNYNLLPTPNRKNAVAQNSARSFSTQLSPGCTSQEQWLVNQPKHLLPVIYA